MRTILALLKHDQLDEQRVRQLRLEISTEHQLRRIVKMIFDETCSRPDLCEKHAYLCKWLSGVTVQSERDAKPIEFDTVLLETSRSLFRLPDNVMEKLNAFRLGVEDEQMKQGKMNKLKNKHFGSIKLIGALYVNDLLTDEFMHFCIDELIAIQDGDSIKRLRSLYKLIGEKYENGCKANVEQQASTLNDLLEQETTSDEIKKFIRTILDARRSDWKVWPTVSWGVVFLLFNQPI